ncbi:OsmC family protein [Actinocorallia sp. API 0066]|uniref:OsmC family protein n=1 Tax=Actinocorallia sp. API 0066 TaxID=2896846 RepID=UPI001E64F95B|nr:OsmC family protein [Actinocorallia sp. API 0066]MCD0448878.1 OsmC family protein [Actinocorallia sp. API 0066]
MNEITVVHQDQDSFAILIRDHVFHVDQPCAGGYDAGPTAPELFVASVAACAAHNGRRHLKEHGLPYSGLEVGVDFTMAPGAPPRVAEITLTARVPWPLTADELAGLRVALTGGSVHAALRLPPVVTAATEAAPEPTPV